MRKDESVKSWDDWRWQLANRIMTVERLAEYTELTEDEIAGIKAAGERFVWSITPYYASLMDREDRNCPIRMQAVPCERELHDDLGIADPLEEGVNSPVEVCEIYFWQRKVGRAMTADSAAALSF